MTMLGLAMIIAGAVMLTLGLGGAFCELPAVKRAMSRLIERTLKWQDAESR